MVGCGLGGVVYIADHRRMYRVRKGARDDQSMRADQAVETHRSGDQYTDDMWLYRLHRQHVDHGPASHFEFEPRWNSVRTKGGLHPYYVR